MDNIQSLELEVQELEEKLRIIELKKQRERLKNKIAKLSPTSPDGLSHKILKLVAKKDEVTASVIKTHIRDFKDTPSDEINKLLLLLIENDKLVRIPTNRGVKVKIK